MTREEAIMALCTHKNALEKYMDYEGWLEVTEAIEVVCEELKQKPAIAVLSEESTNGEVIKTLFPSAEVFETDGFGYEHVYVTVDKSSSSWKIQREWWDSPYLSGR